MRAVGYSLRTAIADIIDNSISAGSKVVAVQFDGHGGSPYVSILDDGHGMDEGQALTAMRLAGVGASEERSANDLGRFGLGLKTASLSQCRRLTVVSKQGATIVALRWDLVYLRETRSWDVLVLDEEDLLDLPNYHVLREQENGTLVIWQDLDRLSSHVPDFAHYLDAEMVDVTEHLSLVFHRFISGDGFPRVAITVNANSVEPADPFLSKSKGTQPSPIEVIEVAGEKVTVQAFTLPYVGKMSPAERKRATANGGLRDSQGFYIYRAGRLVIWGTWFRLIPRADMSKLTRVRVDVPNSLDHLWSLDIKKSSAIPPAIVRDRLRSLTTVLTLPSERVHSHRGIKVSVDLVRPWDVVEGRDGARYELNRDHPLLRAIGDNLDASALATLEDALRVIESTLPIQDIHNRMSNDRLDLDEGQSAEQKDRWRAALLHLWGLSSQTEGADTFLNRLLSAQPFSALSDEKEDLMSQLQNTEGNH